ncbi:MAG: hypothetical protein JXA69_18575 [Phycisphaerae bacterium]|nr:hypothetical protein [Phycisphaerae bacterium]
MPNTDSRITALIEDFAKQIIAATETAAVARVQAVLAAAFGTPARRGPGRPKKAHAPAAAPAPAKPAKRRKPKATPALRRARKLQGQYLGALRALNQADRAKVKALAKAKGVPEALKLAASLKAKK